MKKKFLEILHSQPSTFDVCFLLLFAVFITFQPYYLEGVINIYELGLYLPGINAILDGEIPYKDFFHLRGPFEIYVPAFLMSHFGNQISVITTFFYVGSVLTILLGILIAKELFKTKYFFYLMTFVFTGKTFPRVVFKYWGGMRYVLGLLAIYCTIQFLKRRRLTWIFVAGLVSACALFTSIEIGVSAVIGIIVSMIFSSLSSEYKKIFYIKAGGVYLAGILFIALPYMFYLMSHEALFPYIDGVYSVVSNMQTVINHHVISEYPSNFIEYISALINPGHDNFQHMTPTYLYLSLGCYLIFRMRRNRLTDIDQCLSCLGIYGLVIYISSFRSIWGAQFEMALQPEKILYFFILEEIYLYSLVKKKAILNIVKTDFPPRRPYLWQYTFLYTILLYFLWVSTNSIGYSLMRYTKRFDSFRYCLAKVQGKKVDDLRPLAGESSRELALDRGRNMVTTVNQATELEEVTRFITENTEPDDIIFMFPERGIINFFSDRRFLGRFPTATLSWFNDNWHRELVDDVHKAKPPLVIMPKVLQKDKFKVYFSLKENKRKYDELMGIINRNYEVDRTTPHSYIYKRKDINWVR